ncbi:MAG: cell division protein FtsW [Rhodospirillales bacterium]|jgi:cell division protein FtsW|nr:cell division protein FtsW [Rhodospirillales bacterium]
MSFGGRTDRSIVGRWWWTVDRWTLAALFVLIGTGLFLTLAASPSVATRIGADSFHFVRRQFIFLLPAVVVILMVSMLDVKSVRRLAVIGFLGSLVLMALTLIVGPEIKGATRWLNLAGLTIQPSEFMKPTFAVTIAWLFAAQKSASEMPGNWIAGGLFVVTAGLLLLQPDVGMTLVTSAVFFAEFFLAGLSMIWVAMFALLGCGGVVGAYFLFPHVQSRVQRFLDPQSGDSYQVMTAMQAFGNGGLWGRGPGEGSIKESLPDAHTDFILAVAGEEFGLFLCLFVVALFAFIVLRGFARMYREESLFVLLAVSGLLVQFGLQAVVNMASTLHLMPTKGMTLPFISYGGSSMLALALGMGMMLALSRKRFTGGGWS